MIKRRGRPKATTPKAAVLLRMPQELLDAVDRYCPARSSREKFIRNAISRAVAVERGGRARQFVRLRQKGAAAGI